MKAGKFRTQSLTKTNLGNSSTVGFSSDMGYLEIKCSAHYDATNKSFNCYVKKKNLQTDSHLLENRKCYYCH